MLDKLCVFLAGCSYGLLSIFLKLAYGKGFEASEVVGAQYFMGWLILLVLALFRHSQKIHWKTALALMLVGITNALTAILYSEALQIIPASIGIVLMFQFAWMGIVIEAIAERKFPSKEKLCAIPFLFIGTVLASGVFEGEINFSLWGCVLALLAAFANALFIYCNGRVATHVSTLTRALWITSGVLVFIAFVYPPQFLINGALVKGLAWYGLILALIAVVIPNVLIAKGTPKVGGGLASILISSELPMTIIFAAIVLKEPVSLLQWIGIIAILIGICTPYFLAVKTKHMFNKQVH